MQTAAILDLSAIPSAQRAAVQALLEEVAALKEKRLKIKDDIVSRLASQAAR